MNILIQKNSKNNSVSNINLAFTFHLVNHVSLQDECHAQKIVQNSFLISTNNWKSIY